MADRRVALVTGAARNIGLTIARRLAAEGYLLVLGDRDGEALGEAERSLDGEAVAYTADLATPEGATGLVDVALERWQRLDVLVNNAGGGVIRPFLAHDQQTISETIARNLLTTVHCCRAALPALRGSPSGRIVNIGAESVRNGLWMHAMYNAAKGGVHGLTTGLAREFAPDGITVNCVAPAIVATDEVEQALAASERLPEEARVTLQKTIETIPLGRAARAEEVAAAVAFLCSEEASFVTGQVISVNGGSSML